MAFDLDDEEYIATRKMLGVDKTADKRIKELEADLYSANSIIDELIEVNKELEAKLEFKEWGDLDDLKFEEYIEELLQEREDK